MRTLGDCLFDTLMVVLLMASCLFIGFATGHDLLKVRPASSCPCPKDGCCKPTGDQVESVTGRCQCKAGCTCCPKCGETCKPCPAKCAKDCPCKKPKGDQIEAKPNCLKSCGAKCLCRDCTWTNCPRGCEAICPCKK